MSSLSVSDLAKIQTVKYANLGSLAILVFDYCVTFPEEVKWTWFKPWDFTRVNFTISRYLPFAGFGMTAYGESPHSDAPYLLTIVAAIVTDLSSKMLIPGEEPPLGTCYFKSTRNAAVVYMFLAMFESVVLALTVYKRVPDYRGFQSGTVVTPYHDGMVYMLCILSGWRYLALKILSSNMFREAITLANVIVGAAFPSTYIDLEPTALGYIIASWHHEFYSAFDIATIGV
ncbi:hypothetical protein EDB19DRAFT_1914428 [Suillus lakei]|nr:hypothetical protein EDB19DRAFT_1914428 [Suillus lakei]